MGYIFEVVAYKQNSHCHLPNRYLGIYLKNIIMQPKITQLIIDNKLTLLYQ